jgi:hypothetical protein
MEHTWGYQYSQDDQVTYHCSWCDSWLKWNKHGDNWSPSAQAWLKINPTCEDAIVSKVMES